jgi:hypothetical protein
MLFISFHTVAQTAKVTVKVIDEETGDPIQGAEVSAGFDQSIEPGWGWGAGRPDRDVGVTDENGLIVLSEKTDMGSVGIAVMRSEKYYGGGGISVDFTGKGGLLNRYWRPWNPTIEIKLRKVANPTPLFAKDVKEKLPKEEVPVGYDLLVGDWMPPYGKGKTSDFVFQFTREDEKVVPIKKVGLYGQNQMTLIHNKLFITSPGSGNGFILTAKPSVGKAGSTERMLPFTAPLIEYQNQIIHHWQNFVDKPYRKTVSQDANYFFRVRTKLDENGEVKEALYGKIYGDFDYDLSSREISFKYYINPTPNDRNLEFDPDQNLNPDVKMGGKISGP